MSIFDLSTYFPIPSPKFLSTATENIYPEAYGPSEYVRMLVMILYSYAGGKRLA
jgi:hypothetical protein